MIRIALLAALVSMPAWATGERVRLTTAAEPLREALCVSMECVSDGPIDATVSAKESRGGLELFVTRNGATHPVMTATLVEGKLSSFDAIRASSAVVSAIEGRLAPLAAAAPKPTTPRPAKKKAPSFRLVARR